MYSINGNNGELTIMILVVNNKGLQIGRSASESLDVLIGLYDGLAKEVSLLETESDKLGKNWSALMQFYERH